MTAVTKRVLLVAKGDDGELYPLRVDPVTGYLHTDAVINVASLTVDSDVSDRSGRLLGRVTSIDSPVALDATTLAALENIGVTVSNPGLTDAQLRAVPVPVSGIVSTGLTQPLTDAQLRATRVPVDVEIDQPLTDAQLRAVAVPVSLSGTVATDMVDESTRLLGKETTATDLMRRCLKFEPVVGEEIRRDETVTDDYHGIAADGTATNATSWSVVRFYKDVTGKITRVRYRSGVAWDSRTVGWA